MTDRELALFLRWLLKHYTIKTTDDGFFYWVDSMGIEILPETIINDYKTEQEIEFYKRELEIEKNRIKQPKKD
jgi:hypothetical protein